MNVKYLVMLALTLVISCKESSFHSVGEPHVDSEDDFLMEYEPTIKADFPGGWNRIPDRAVVKGSFSVFAEPPNPRPREPYLITVDVDLAAADLADGYSYADLSGSISGTDGFFFQLESISNPNDYEYLGFSYSPEFAPFFEFYVLIPGAMNLVKDTIAIKSNLLNEAQEIEIIFN